MEANYRGIARIFNVAINEGAEGLEYKYAQPQSFLINGICPIGSREALISPAFYWPSSSTVLTIWTDDRNKNDIDLSRIAYSSEGLQLIHVIGKYSLPESLRQYDFILAGETNAGIKPMVPIPGFFGA